MLLENDLYPQDVRVRHEAETLATAGYRVKVIAPRGAVQGRREVINDVDVERFRLRMEHPGRMGDLVREYVVAHCQLYSRALRALIQGTEVLHVHNPPDTLFLPAVIGRVVGCRFVFDQHDLFPELFEQKFGVSPIMRLTHCAQRASVRLANLVIATNESQRQAALRAGASREKVIVVRNAIRRTELGVKAPVRPGELKDPRLLYVGALDSQDGVQRLPDLLRTLIAVHGLTGVTLTVVGWGAERKTLERRLKDLGMCERVTFTGRLDHDRVLELIRGADICIDTAECSQLNHETTMVKIVEYLLLGQPTVAFALRETERTAGGAAAIAECGRWDQFADLVAELAGSEARRRALSERARARAAALVWENQEPQLLRGYERIL